MKKTKTIILLLSIFAISIPVRIQFINNNVKFHEINFIEVLTVLDNWQAEGIIKNGFNLRMTYNNAGDKHISNYTRLEDENGNNYYTSAVPLKHISAYLYSKLPFFQPNKSLLQIIHIISHFIGAFFLYLLICAYYNKTIKIFFPAIIAFTTYTFAPIMLSATISYSIIGYSYLISGIYFAYIIFCALPKGKTYRTILFIAFGLNTFLLTYSEWIGAFYCFSIIVVCLFYSKSISSYRKIIGITTASFMVSISLFLLQYTRISDLNSLYHSLLIRLVERSGFFGSQYSDQGLSILNIEAYELLAHQLHYLLTGFGYITIILLIVYLFQNKKKKFIIKFSQHQIILFLLITTPVLMHFIIFFNANVLHVFLLTKFYIPIAVLSGITTHRIIHNTQENRKRISIITISTLFITTSIYSSYNFFPRHDIYDCENHYFHSICKIISKNSEPNEAIFINIDKEFRYAMPFLTYITKRNMMCSKNISSSKQIAIEKNKKKGVFFNFAHESNSYMIKHFDINK